MRLLQILSVLCISFFACQTDDPEPGPEDQGTVYVNGQIYTVNSTQTRAEAFWIKDGVFQAVGSNEEVRNSAPEGTAVVDLEGLMVMPGIHDVHLHPLEASSDNFQFVVDVEETDPENYQDDVERAINENPDSEWLLGWGHDFHALLDGARREPIEILDEVAPDVAVAIMEQTSHSLWVNSKALEMAGYSSDPEDPPGGIIMRGDNGAPNGILVDNAGNILLDVALSPTPERAQKDYDGLISFGLPELAKNGITSVCDARLYWKRNHHEVWKRIESEGKLTVRANLGLWLYPTGEDEAQIDQIRALYSNDPGSLLRINQIKVYSDGIIHNTTSAMHDHFKIDLFNIPMNNGLNYVSEDRLVKYIEALEPDGFDFHIHAIGDRGIHEALNAIERGGSAAGRHRLTHVEFVDPTDYPRFSQLNVTADAQVAGEFTQPEHWSENEAFVDVSLTKNVVPLKDFLNAGARLTLSSDWDVSDLNPFVGMQNAVTRAPQNISLDEVIKAYTVNAAYVMRQEDKVGSIERGKEADFIVLNQNIFEIPVDKISQTEVLETYLRGTAVFQK